MVYIVTFDGVWAIVCTPVSESNNVIMGLSVCVCDLKLHLSSSGLVLQKASPPEFLVPSLCKGTRKCIKLPEDLPEVSQVFVSFAPIHWISCFILGKRVFLFKFTQLGLYIFQILIIYSYLKILHV